MDVQIVSIDVEDESEEQGEEEVTDLEVRTFKY